MKNVNLGANANGVKKVDVQSMKQQMMQGYLEMAKINKQICEEFLPLCNEAENTIETFLGN